MNAILHEYLENRARPTIFKYYVCLARVYVEHRWHILLLFLFRNTYIYVCTYMHMYRNGNLYHAMLAKWLNLTNSTNCNHHIIMG